MKHCSCGYVFSSARDRFAVDVELPQVRQATEKVLVMTYMDGMRISDRDTLDRHGVDRQRLVEGITRAYAHQIYVDGLFNADPHPGNFLVSRSLPHRPVLLDFGLTKRIDQPMREALAKMLLVTAQGDAAMLLSAFEQMGLRLRSDVPDDAMDVTSYFFRRAAPPKESQEESKKYFQRMKQRAKDREEESKEKEEIALKEEEEEEGGREAGTKQKPRNPVDAFPGELVFFIRVLNLLRGLSSSLGARVAYLEIMRPFAEAVLSRQQRPLESPSNWFRACSLSREPLRSALQKLLWGYHKQGKVLGFQVYVYKDGQVVLDAAAGYLGEFDPRPVQHDSLFPVFSATKGVTAALVHWLVLQRRCVSYDSLVSSLWPGFEAKGKDKCTVAHVLTHRAGLEAALASDFLAEPTLLCDWEETKRRLAAHAPSSPPGEKEAYHYLTYGWLAGGVVEGAAGSPFQRVLQEVLEVPLGVQGEFYVGIPPGVEARLASLCFERGTDPARVLKRSGLVPTSAAATGSVPPLTSQASSAPDSAPAPVKNGASSTPAALPDKSGKSQHGPQDGEERNAGVESKERKVEEEESSSAASGELPQDAVAAVPSIFNSLFVRRAVIPSANGHFSARALARFYAALAAHGLVPSPPPTTLASQPPLGTTAPKPKGEQATDRAEKRWGRSWALSALAQALFSAAAAASMAVRRLRMLVPWQVKERRGGKAGGKEEDEGECSFDPLLAQERGDKAISSGGGSSSGIQKRESHPLMPNGDTPSIQQQGEQEQRLFSHPHAVDAFLGIGEYGHLADGHSTFGLGFIRYPHTSSPKPNGLSVGERVANLAKENPEMVRKLKENPEMARKFQEVMQNSSSRNASGGANGVEQPRGQKLMSRCAFGHAGLGGSVAFCDPNHNFAVAILLNQLSFDREVVSAVVRLICIELEVPVPAQFKLRDAAAASADTMLSAMQG